MVRLFRLILTLAALLAVALSLAGSAVSPRPTQAAAEPLDVIPLDRLGYTDSTLRGRTVSTEYFVPGPGEFILGDESWLDLDYLSSSILAPDSVMTVLWNGLPVADRPIGGATARSRLTILLPGDRINPDANRIQVQASLHLAADDCGVQDDQGRHLTVFASSRVRYSYADRAPHPAPAVPDLARFPAPFASASVTQPAPVRFVIPSEPDDAELSALLRLAARFGSAASTRSLDLAVYADGQWRAADLSSAHVVFVGRADALPSLSRLTTDTLTRDTSGRYVDQSGEAAPEGTGVVFAAPSPWNAGRLALAVTGVDDAAVERAALALTGPTALRGSFAFIQQVATATPPKSVDRIQLADLGLGDQAFTGTGDHTVSLTLDMPPVAKQTSVPLSLVVSHSSLLDQARSSLRLVVGGVPLSTIAFKDIPAERGTRQVQIPAGALHPGPNTVRLELSLRLPRLGDQTACASEPGEQAWAVVHGDSFLAPPPAAVGGSLALSSLPFPLVRQGSLDQALVVTPPGPDSLTPLVRAVAELGKSARPATMGVTAIRASRFAPDMAAGRDVAVWGRPDENPLIAKLGGRLPVQVDRSQRLLLTRDMTLAVRDPADVAVIQEAGSPWDPDRGLVVMTGSGDTSLSLAADALRAGGLGGNAVLISRAVDTPPPPGMTPTPVPLSLGAPAPAALDVSAYQVRPAVAAAGRRLPIVPLAAAALSGAAALAAGIMAYAAFAPRARRLRRPR